MATLPRPVFPMETSPRARRPTQFEAAWALFCDWAEATDRNPFLATPPDLDPFLRQNPCASSVAALRVRAISIRLGWIESEPQEATHRAWPEEDEWLLPLGEALERISISGWPRGFRGRRDAFLLTLLGHVGMTRSQALATTAEDLNWSPDGWYVGDDLIPSTTGESPQICLSCAVSRWLAVLGENEHWSSSSARTFLASSRQFGVHECQDAVLSEASSYWREAYYLLPAIDRYGMTAKPVHQSMSERAVTSVIASRRARLLVTPPQPPVAEPVEIAEIADSSPRFEGYSWDEVEALLDDTCDRADEINARMTALLDDTTAWLSPEQRRPYATPAGH